MTALNIKNLPSANTTLFKSVQSMNTVAQQSYEYINTSAVLLKTQRSFKLLTKKIARIIDAVHALR